MDVAPGIVRRENRVRVVTVRARWSINVAATQQELAVSAGPVLSQLVGVQPILPHAIGVRVARRAELDGLDLGRMTEKSPRVSWVYFHGCWVATMTVVALDAALRVDSQAERSPLVRMANEARVAGISLRGCHTLRRLVLSGKPPG